MYRIASLSIRLPIGWNMYVSTARPAPGRLLAVAVVENELTELALSSLLEEYAVVLVEYIATSLMSSLPVRFCDDRVVKRFASLSIRLPTGW